MYTIWRTGHHINEEVTKAIRIGSQKLSPHEPEFLVKDVSLRSPGDPVNHSIAYGILRGTADVFKDCDAQHKEWWEIDRGYFKPAHFNGYYRISLKRTRAYYSDEVAGGLPDDRFQALNVAIHPWRQEAKGYILLCPPTEPVCEFYGVNRNHWIDEFTKQAKEASGRLVRIRDKDTTTPLRYDLMECHAVITYNSNVALDALASGVPAISCNSEVRQWNNLTVFDLKKPYSELIACNRLKLFRFLSYCQFTLDEFKKGYAWKTANDVQKYGGLY